MLRRQIAVNCGPFILEEQSLAMLLFNWFTSVYPEPRISCPSQKTVWVIKSIFTGAQRRFDRCSNGIHQSYSGAAGAQRQIDITRSAGQCSRKIQMTHSELKMADWLLETCMLLKRSTAKQVNHPFAAANDAVLDKK